MGLWQRKSRNSVRRANGNEPEPGAFAGVKRWRRYHARVAPRKIKIKNPERYLSASARRRVSA